MNSRTQSRRLRIAPRMRDVLRLYTRKFEAYSRCKLENLESKAEELSKLAVSLAEGAYDTLDLHVTYAELV